MIHVDVRIESDSWTESLPDASEICREMVEAALSAGAPGSGACETSVVLTDDTAIARLNREFRGVDGPTNVLSFPTEATSPDKWRPMPDGIPRLIGDVMVAHETSASEATAAGRPFVDHFRHLVVHGVLHLLGCDHENAADAARMEALEAAILAEFGVGNPYADPIEESPFVA